jgi:hypothetical protein
MAKKGEKAFIYVSPNQLEGDPYEVAGAACKQASSVAMLLELACDGAFKMARIAEMEREQQADEEPDGASFEHKPLGVRMLLLQTQAKKMARDLQLIAQAASFDPKNIEE